jgi:hypothetical protein
MDRGIKTEPGSIPAISGRRHSESSGRLAPAVIATGMDPGPTVRVRMGGWGIVGLVALPAGCPGRRRRHDPAGAGASTRWKSPPDLRPPALPSWGRTAALVQSGSGSTTSANNPFVFVNRSRQVSGSIQGAAGA